MAPPEKRSSMPTSWLVSKTLRNVPTLTPGTGTWDTKRKTTNRAAVNSSLRRRSGILKALNSAPSMPMGNLLDLAARCLDPLTRGLGEAVGANGQGVLQVALSQDLDQLRVIE